MFVKHREKRSPQSFRTPVYWRIDTSHCPGTEGNGFPKGNESAVLFLSDSFFAYGCTMGGTSHLKSEMPCQDYSDLCWIRAGGRLYLLSAIADGVGSCACSHEGSSIAVRAALDYCARFFSQMDGANDDAILSLLRDSFRYAWRAVEQQAKETGRLPFSFFTTLTLCVYDGDRGYIGHIGDDGVVALYRRDGRIALATRRDKGDTANSVVPLQAGEENWQFFATEECADGFLLATDGVLDSFVTSARYGTMVYEPFMTPYFFRPLWRRNDVERALDQMLEFLNSTTFRRRVQDDITLLVMGNRKTLSGQTSPPFDVAEWDRIIRAVDRKTEAILNRKSVPDEMPRPFRGRKEPIDPWEQRDADWERARTEGGTQRKRTGREALAARLAGILIGLAWRLQAWRKGGAK